MESWEASACVRLAKEGGVQAAVVTAFGPLQFEKLAATVASMALLAEAMEPFMGAVVPKVFI